jgi:hypothetical protein
MGNRSIKRLQRPNSPVGPFAHLDLDPHLRLTNISTEANLKAAIDGKLPRTLQRIWRRKLT